ncbi:MAG TPA: hypothetical protein VM864_01245 [Pyrinomonadaceae bacterium]|jgi:hypothetical protein|nr:hypothetical protein [Pyrinomonadaceae bacterium]
MRDEDRDGVTGEGLIGSEDAEFIRRFESCELPPAEFPHREHVRLAWLYVRRGGAREALARFSTGLRRYAAFNGKPDLYHETITWAYILLINERAARAASAQGWEEFAAANPDLLDWQNSVLKTYYREETLGSELAKKVFLFPDGRGEAGGEAR